jgi:hypothetical protein
MLQGLIALLASTSAFAAVPHETFYYEGAPTPDLVARWSALPGSRSFLIRTDSATRWELEALLPLRGADRLQIEAARFPGEDSVDAWKKLAVRGAELVVLDGGLPTDDEIDRLNRIGLAGHLFVLTGFPGEDDAKRLARLQGPVSLTLVTRLYPRFVDRDSFRALPPGLPLLFSTDYWPWYTHMDVMNMIPQPLRLRVKDMFPPEESLQYLHAIKRLREVSVDTDYDAPDAREWEKFGALPVRWSSRGRVPSAEGLAAFERSGRLGPRRLTIDSDTAFTDEESGRLTRSPLAVEWIHLAPLYR